jgi:hypothetical protein
MDTFIQSMKEQNALDEFEKIYNKCPNGFRFQIKFKEVEEAICKGDFKNIIKRCEEVCASIPSLPTSVRQQPLDAGYLARENLALEQFMKILRHTVNILRSGDCCGRDDPSVKRPQKRPQYPHYQHL